MAKRLNIGLLVDDIDAVFTNDACKGAVLGAESIDANLFIFPGGYLDTEDISSEHYKYEYQYNTIFSYANQNNLDVLYVMMGTIGSRVQVEERVAFLKQYTEIPVVVLYTKMEEYPSIIFDNHIGFGQAIRHLIEVHHVERLGYVSGPKTNVDAKERLQTYKSVLEEYHIPFREDYVVYGNFEESTGPLAGELVVNHPELQGIAFANDRMAFGAYRAFKMLDIKVGEDLLVVSFDNSSFASSMIPPLSTVASNATELAYHAVIHTDQFLHTGKLDLLDIKTHLVVRSSCGCRETAFEQLLPQMGLNQKNCLKEVDVARLHHYLFGNYGMSVALQKIEDDLVVFIKLLVDMVESDELVSYTQRAKALFHRLISQPILDYTSVEKFFNLLFCMQRLVVDSIPTEKRQIACTKLFSDFYRTLAISNCQVVQDQQVNVGRTSHLVNSMTVNLFMMENATNIPWSSALENLYSIGFKSVYLYAYQDIIEHNRYDDWKAPMKMLLKSYSNEKGAYNIPEDQQIISTTKLLQHQYMPTDRRLTMVLSPLFSGKELYGLLLSEVDFTGFGYVAPISFQLSSALKSIFLIEKQQMIQKQLEESIIKFRENNDFLNVISRSDELTGLYNRRGFLEFAHAAIVNRKNEGKRAMVVYADMDNLKMINDNYGHDEGDFALRELAAILKDTFRSTDIIARFGGDEFVVFALVGIDDYQDIMKRRINEITLRHNQAVKKPYPIEMSTGIHEFGCGSSVDLYELLDVADERLYEEKKAKKEVQGSYR